MQGRPVIYIGVRTQDLRIRYRSLSGRHTRGFYARWRPRILQWECQLSGFGMPPARWLSASQTLALARLRSQPCMWDNWKPLHSLKSAYADLWDGIPDNGYCTPGGPLVELFPVPSWQQGSAAA